MAEEMLDYFDENYVRQGSAPKSRTRAKGLWVHSFHCWMLSTSDVPSLLVQKRAKTKELFPDFLDISAAGHLAAGERVEQGVREITEETGLKVPFSDLISLGIKHDVAKTKNIINRQFCHVFLYPKAPSIDALQLDRVELDGMVSIPVADGLRLFAGEVDSLRVGGVEKNARGDWSRIEKKVSKGDFIPRVDSYYFKMFILADQYLKGYKYLSI